MDKVKMGAKITRKIAKIIVKGIGRPWDAKEWTGNELHKNVSENNKKCKMLA